MATLHPIPPNRKRNNSERPPVGFKDTPQSTGVCGQVWYDIQLLQFALKNEGYDSRDSICAAPLYRYDVGNVT